MWRYFLEGQEVTALAVAPDGALWVGAGCELRRWDGSAWRLMGRCGDDFPQGNILELAFTADGAAWLANGLGLARLTGNEWTTFELLANSVLVAPDGGIWINGWEGVQDSNYVARLSGSEWTTYPVSDSFPGSFRAGAVTADGRLWGIVSERGLAAFDGRSWSEADSWAYYAPAGDLDVTAILGRAPDGALWLRTGRGVARLDLTQLAGGDAPAAWTTYDLAEGKIEVGPGAVAFGPNGEVWFGATRFDPQR
jgi:ligand-binding sensor domain-containing protein